MVFCVCELMNVCNFAANSNELTMYNYTLFIDTETSDKPKRWNASTDKVEKWPYILQIAWIVCTKDGQPVLTRDFYIKHQDIEIDEQAGALHGITLDLLQEKGVDRKVVLSQLAADIEKYQPLIVGHFLAFDRKMMEVGFSREEISRNFEHLPKFCTMQYSRQPSDFIGGQRCLRLNELYQKLFGRSMENPHNALSDAEATRDCFFELQRRGDLKAEAIWAQNRLPGQSWKTPKSLLLFFSLIIFASFVALLLYLYF